MSKLYRACALLLPLSVATLAGCGSTGAVMSVGPDTYMVSADKHYLSGGEASAKTNALGQANKKCVDEGKQVVVNNVSSTRGVPFSTATVTFQCLSPGDRDLRRPSYQQSPDIVIENR